MELCINIASLYSIKLERLKKDIGEHLSVSQ